MIQSEKFFNRFKKEDRWDAPNGANESLEIVILRKRKLGEFVNSLLTELTI